MSSVPTTSASPARRDWSFPVDGMSCVACAGRVERALRAVPGVAEASVNMATEIASVHADEPLPFDGLQAAVRKAGYAARPPETPAPPVPTEAQAWRPVVMAAALRRLDVDALPNVDAEAVSATGVALLLGGGVPVGELRSVL